MCKRHWIITTTLVLYLYCQSSIGATVSSSVIGTTHQVLLNGDVQFQWLDDLDLSIEGHVYQGFERFVEFEKYSTKNGYLYETAGLECCEKIPGSRSSAALFQTDDSNIFSNIDKLYHVTAYSGDYGNAMSKFKVSRNFQLDGVGVADISFASLLAASIEGEVLGGEEVQSLVTLSSSLGHFEQIEYSAAGIEYGSGTSSPDTWDILDVRIWSDGFVEGVITFEGVSFSDTGITEVPLPGTFWMFFIAIAKFRVLVGVTNYFRKTELNGVLLK